MKKTHCGNEELAFLASAIKEGRTSRRRRLQMQLALNNRRLFLNLVCLLLLFIPKGTTQFLVQFLQDQFILPFSLKNMSCSMPPNWLFNPLDSYTEYRSGLCTSSKYISCSRNKRVERRSLKKKIRASTGFELVISAIPRYRYDALPTALSQYVYA